MYTPEFEAWWAHFKVYGAIEAAWIGLHEAALKKCAWLAWRTGREKMHEETIHLHLKRA